MEHITVALLEAKELSLYSKTLTREGVIEPLNARKHDISAYTIASDTDRLIEEISRRITSFWEDNKRKDDTLLLSLPGTLQDQETLISSSRLGIRKPINVAKSIRDHLRISNCYIFHDTECLCIGEVKYGEHLDDIEHNSIVYILVDEGIGSKILIDGKLHKGTGTAGLLGRLVVQPDGAYYPALRSSGVLEVYSSRPWVSRRLVEVYESELDKKGYKEMNIDNNLSKFRQALKTASDKKTHSEINYERIADGMNEQDPIAINVIETATKYLGYALNTVITLINPSLIILGGDMVTKIPHFPEKTLNYTRQYCWATAWNNTNIKTSTNDREFQVLGCIDLYRDLKQNNA